MRCDECKRCVRAPSFDTALHDAGKPAHPYRWFLDTPAGEEPSTILRDAAMEATIVTGRPASAAVGSFTPLDQHDWERYRLADTAKRPQPRLDITTTAPSFDALTILVPGQSHRKGCTKGGPTVTHESGDGDELVVTVGHGKRTQDRITLRLTEGDDAFRIERATKGKPVRVASIDPSQRDIDEEPLDEPVAEDLAALVRRVTGLPVG